MYHNKYQKQLLIWSCLAITGPRHLSVMYTINSSAHHNKYEAIYPSIKLKMFVENQNNDLKLADKGTDGNRKTNCGLADQGLISTEMFLLGAFQ